ncbi:hypothetical protein ACG7TL_003042 [Trametes sanguinea]
MHSSPFLQVRVPAAHFLTPLIRIDHPPIPPRIQVTPLVLLSGCLVVRAWLSASFSLSGTYSHTHTCIIIDGGGGGGAYGLSPDALSRSLDGYPRLTQTVLHAMMFTTTKLMTTPYE